MGWGRKAGNEIISRFLNVRQLVCNPIYLQNLICIHSQHIIISKLKWVISIPLFQIVLSWVMFFRELDFFCHISCTPVFRFPKLLYIFIPVIIHPMKQSIPLTRQLHFILSYMFVSGFPESQRLYVVIMFWSIYATQSFTPSMAVK